MSNTNKTDSGAGLKANAALVQRFPLPAAFDSLAVRPRCSPIELKRALEGAPQDGDSEVDPRFRPQFAECLPEHQLNLFARACLNDWPAASRTRGEAPSSRRRGGT